MDTPDLPADEPRVRRRVFVTAGLTASAAVLALSVQAASGQYGDSAGSSGRDDTSSAAGADADDTA